MPNYMLSVWHDDDYTLDFDSEAMQRIGPKVQALNESMTAAGALVFAGGLMPASSAMVFRSQAGEVTVSAGLYTSGQPHVGGFWVVDAADDAAAQDWARRAAHACETGIELRPFQATG